jgi:hypothetical protein
VYRHSSCWTNSASSAASAIRYRAKFSKALLSQLDTPSEWARRDKL